MWVFVVVRFGIQYVLCRLLDELLFEVDVVSLYCQFSDDIVEMINVEWFVLMKFSVFLINIVRGGLIDEQVLLIVFI